MRFLSKWSWAWLALFRRLPRQPTAHELRNFGLLSRPLPMPLAPPYGTERPGPVPARWRPCRGRAANEIRSRHQSQHRENIRTGHKGAKKIALPARETVELGKQHAVEPFHIGSRCVSVIKPKGRSPT